MQVEVESVTRHHVYTACMQESQPLSMLGGAPLRMRVCELQALSSVGRCRSFDAAADGYGRGEGVTVLVLAPQQRRSVPSAMMTSPPIAIVVGSAVNQVRWAPLCVTQARTCSAIRQLDSRAMTPANQASVVEPVLAHAGWPLQRPHSAQWALAEPAGCQCARLRGP